MDLRLLLQCPRSCLSRQAQCQGRRARRKRRYDEVIALHQQGASQVAIAALVGLHRDTVRRYINAASFPEIVRPGKRSKLDPYKAYLQERWNAGQHNIKQLVAELREQGIGKGKRSSMTTSKACESSRSGWKLTLPPRRSRPMLPLSFPFRHEKRPGSLPAIPRNFG